MTEDYTYIVARLRALEAAMPDRAWFERLVRTPDENLLGALREHYHGFESISSAFEFEQALEAEKAWILDLITTLFMDERSKLFIRAGYDFDNLTHAWKAAKLAARPALTPFGLVPAETIGHAVSNRVRGILPVYLELHIEMLNATYEEKKSLAACEYAAERAKWRFLFEGAPGREARNYLRCKADLVNIKNFVRLRRTALRKEGLDAVWIEGGEIETARFRELFLEPEEEFYTILPFTAYGCLLGLGLSKETSLWRMDSIMRRALMEMLGESRYRFFDISPVLFHIELRERDFEILRRIIVGALNKIPEEMKLERVGALLPS